MKFLQGKLLIAVKIEPIKNDKSYSLPFQCLCLSFTASNNSVTLGFEMGKRKKRRSVVLKSV